MVAAGHAAHATTRSRGLAYLIAVTAVVALGATASIGLTTAAYHDRIVPGVRVDDVDVGGLGRADAESVLASAFASLERGQVVVETPDGAVPFGMAAFGRSADAAGMVAAALAVGRGGGALAEAAAILSGAANPVTLGVQLRLDDAAVETALTRVARSLDREPIDARIIRSGGRFVVSPAVAGRVGAENGLAATLARELRDPAAAATVRLALPVASIPARLTTSRAEGLAARANAVVRPVRLRAGDRSARVSAAAIGRAIRFVVADGKPRVALDEATVRKLVRDVASRLATKPVNATYLVARSGRVIGARAGSAGTRVDVAATADRVMTALLAPGVGARTVDAVTRRVEPAFTTDDARRTAPLMVRVGQWSTYYQVGAHNGYGANITIPARTLNGFVVGPGETFDFWRALGEVSFRTGYRLGGAIVGGHSVEGTALAGGICAASTTLFNAAVRAGYPIIARSPHWYYITRYPLGLDATVSESQSMRFRNDTRFPLVIVGRASPGVVHFEIWTVPTGRTTTFSRPVVKNVIRGYETVRYTSSLPKGTREQIEWAADGKDVWVTRTVRAADGSLVRRDTFYSHYHRMIGVTLVGTG